MMGMVLGGSLAMTLLLGQPAESPPRYFVSEIRPAEELQSYWLAPMNEDDLLDLLVCVWSASRQRELTVYLQDARGDFAGTPDWRVPIKSDIVAYAAADLRPEPGAELLLLTRSSGFSLSPRRSAYRGNARKIFSWGFLCAVPDEKTVLRLPSVEDLNRDGHPELLVPGVDGYGLFMPSAGNDSTYVLETTIAALSQSQPDKQVRRRVGVSFRDGLISHEGHPFDGLVRERESAAATGGGDFLSAAHWLPACHVGDLDGDGRRDLVLLDSFPESRRLRIHRQNGRGAFGPEPDVTIALAKKGRWLPVDWNVDGATDLVQRIGGPGSESTTLRFFANRKDEAKPFDVQTPTQVLKLSGHGLSWRIAQIDGEGLPELFVASHHISTLGALKGGRVTRTLLIYRGDPDGAFEKRPSFKREKQYSAAEAVGLDVRVRIDGDLQGKGRTSLLSIDGRGALAVRAVSPTLQIAKEPYWRLSTRWRVESIDVVTANPDRRSDLVLRHSRAVTILVSQ